MERKGKKDGLLERTAAVFDIPGDVVGLPKVELLGRHELRMENHKGILAYGTQEVIISGGRLLVKVKGENLELKAMSGEELLVGGTIFSVELE